MSFTNVYYKRTAGTEKACYVCYKPTTTVLATTNTVDFLYTCPGHLEDRGFASKLGGIDGAGGARKMGLSDDEIAKVKEEWEQKQKAKLEKEKEKAKREKEREKEKKEGGEGDVKDEDKDKEAKRDGSKSPKTRGSTSSPAPTPPTPTPTHERYALHRDYFAMRQGEHRKRRQLAQAKELAPRLPGVPSGIVQDKY